MNFTPEKLLDRLVLPDGAGRLWVAFSGGLDSTVLLHALAALRDRLPPLAAVHVDHGIHPESSRWVEHCRAVCGKLDIPLESFGIIVDPAPGASLEAAARDARYAIFHEVMETNDVLLTAQHEDDQLETFLLQALRGAGLPGLAAMPERKAFGPGWLIRPLLDVGRADLEAWAREQKLGWIEDPSNADESLDRNYLRRRLAPVLKQRWPSAAGTLSRAARHCAEGEQLAAALAALDLEHCQAGKGVLSVSSLEQLEPVRRRNVLRHWLGWLDFPVPSDKKLAHILNDVIEAAPDAEPRVHWAGVEVRRYRDGLFAFPTPRDEPVSGAWTQPEFDLGEGWGRLALERTDGPGLPERAEWRVAYREGGERIRPPGRGQHHELKKLFQEAGIPPWLRERLPLVWSGENLLAAGDVWINADFAVTPGYRVIWQCKPAMFDAVVAKE